VGAAGAALAVAVLNAGALAGRVLLGGVGDRVPKAWLAGGLFALQAAALVVAAVAGEPVLLLGAAAVIGFTISNVIARQPLLMAERFGLRSYGTVYGPAYLLTQLGAAAGPLLVGLLADRAGSYALPFALAAGTALIATVLVTLAPRPRSV
jgi:MFS family permease